MGKWLQGKFKPNNPEKYVGDVTNIVYRSSWELRMLRWLDKDPSIISYSSEEFYIEYYSPVDNRIHKYFPDFFIKYRARDGSLKTKLIEIKPKKQTMPPVAPKRKTKSFLYELKTWEVNQAKWKAAREFCADRKIDFLIMTEEDMKII